jgi:hypothetical protein
VRLDDLAAVLDRRVGDRHLQRRGLHVALADREVDGVAEVVVAQVRAPAAQGAGLEDVRPLRDLLALATRALLRVDLVAPRRIGDRAATADVAGQVDPGRAVEAEPARPALDDERLAGLVAAVERRHPELVEVDVGGDLQRPGEVDRTVGLLVRVAALGLADLDAAGVVDRRLRVDEALV